MRLGRFVLWVDALTFIGVGIANIVAPEQVSEMFLDTAPATTSGLTDMRAIYGGVSLGLGVLFALCARRPEWERVGLVASALILGGTAVGRIVGLIVDGDPNSNMVVFLVAEIIAVVLSVLALRRPAAGPAT